MSRFLGAVCLVLLASATYAEESAQEKPEELPLPRPVTSHFLPYYLPSSLPNPATREIWQYYGVDGSGRWRPRVIFAPYQSYYLYNGQPFYQTTTRPELHMPYVLD